MGHKQDILAQVAEGVEDVYTVDDSEAEAREAISDAIVEYERLLCREEIEALVAPFTEPEVIFNEEIGVVKATEEDFADLDAVFEEADERYAVKEGKRYRFSAIEKRPAILANKLYACQMDIAGRFVTAGEIASIDYLTGVPVDPMACPVCMSFNTTMVYEDALADTYLCNDCGKSFSVDHEDCPTCADPVTDVFPLGDSVDALVSVGVDGISWAVVIDDDIVLAGTAGGYEEALDNCKLWYECFDGIDVGGVYASAHVGSKMRIESKTASELSGVRLDTGAPFTVKAASFVDQITSGEIIRSARSDMYADVAEEGTQYQGLDGNIIEVMSKSAGMIQYADTACCAPMHNHGAAKWLPTQEFYAMIDKKSYASI